MKKIKEKIISVDQKLSMDNYNRPEINLDLLAKRYVQGTEKTWDDVVMRISKHAAGKKGKNIKDFYDEVYAGNFFPSRMAYMGTPHPFASSCFVFPVEDSLHSIMQTLSDACKVQKFGGGTGYNFSHLRPKGDIINTSKGEASGPVSFMGLYHNAMEVVHRAGKKHAAQMGILNCDHPNILEFIQCKDKEGSYWTFNISVAVTDKFMKAVKNDADWDLQFDGKVYKTIKAKYLWDYIIQHAWYNGDPGIIFIDTVNRNNRYPELIEACNPCGEQMLPPYVSCNLGSIDLSRFVINNEIDWKGLEKTTQAGVRFLDGSVEAAYWPVVKIREKTRKYHNIGLGVMGWADMLILLGIPYDSNQAVELGEKVMKFINDAAEVESKKLGNGKRKNVTLTSIAPTGSISLLAGCSSGIEPVFGIVTMKNTYVGSFKNTHWIFKHLAKKRGFYSEELLEKIATEGSIQNIDEVPDDIKRLFKTAMEVGWEWHVKHQAAFQKYTDNAVSKTINLPNDATLEDVQKAYLTAYETNCKSITVYRDGSRQVQVMDVKTKERSMCPNCNAILFMNDGEKTCVTCGYKPADNEGTLTQESLPVEDPLRHRPYMVKGSTYKMNTPVGTAFITINEDENGDPLEMFINVGKAGSDVAAMAEALGRSISTALKFRGEVSAKEKAREFAEQLSGIGGRRSIGFGPTKIKSLPDAVAGAISVHYDLGINGYHNSPNLFGAKETKLDPQVEVIASAPHVNEKQQESLFLHAKQEKPGDICPTCGAGALVFEEGCSKCHACGHSEC
jgi:ribonucleoside-diphosphate reductase alpha chain